MTLPVPEAFCSSIVILILIYCFFSLNFVVSEFMSIFASRARIDKAEKEIAEGKGVTFTNKNDMNAWLNSL